MPHVIALLLEAMASGGLRLDYGRIHGRAGYVNPATRTIVLNPDASPEQLEAEIAHDLAVLIDAGLPDTVRVPPQRLELAHSTDEPEIPAPRLPDEATPHLRIAE